ncbi:unnamed protein product [Moneuplotes crassus]|uniref:Calpain catalytic domain-containing protein n=1 Tax=Euplotes crassus TaxID=5936 RepID=A0AAD1YAP3_EUPCR|nr:unnamed protein product [Moneuplotes crassus]
MEKISEAERDLEGSKSPKPQESSDSKYAKKILKIISPYSCNLSVSELNAYSELDKTTEMPNCMDCVKYKEFLSKMITKARDLFQFDPLDNMDPKNAQNRVKSRIAIGCDSYEIVSTGTVLACQVREGLCSFIDSDFPPQNSSISPSSSIQPKGIVWLRAHEFMEETSNLFKDEIKFEDVKMGCLATCYFLSSVGQLVNNPDFIKMNFLSLKSTTMKEFTF